MRCDVCKEKIALAKRCPYCGHEVDTNSRKGFEDQDHEEERIRGRFRGSINETARSERSDKTPPSLMSLLRFLASPNISPGRKSVLFLALFYILSPIDLIPGAMFPVLGWFDDLSVMYMAWKWVEKHLKNLD